MIMKRIQLFFISVNFIFQICSSIPLHRIYYRDLADNEEFISLKELFNVVDERRNVADSDKLDENKNTDLLSSDQFFQRNILLRKRRQPLECIQRDDAGHCIQYARPYYRSWTSILLTIWTLVTCLLYIVSIFIMDLEITCSSHFENLFIWWRKLICKNLLCNLCYTRVKWIQWKVNCLKLKLKR